MDYVSILFILLGLFIGSIVLITPRTGVWLLLLSSMVISGTLLYFVPSLSRVIWTVTLISYLLFIRSGIEFLSVFRTLSRPPIFILPMLLFGFSVLLTTAGNYTYLMESFISSKNLFQFWSIPVFFYVAKYDEKDINTLLFAVFLIALLQIPVAMIQQFFVASKITLMPGDVVVGTMGGQMKGGGFSGALSAFLITVTAAIVCLNQKDIISTFKAVMIIALLFIPIFFNETKIILVYVPVVVAMTFGYGILKKPLKSIAMVVVITLITMVVFVYYVGESHKYTETRRKATNISDYLKKTIAKNIEQPSKNKRMALTRIGALTYWWRENTKSYSFMKLFFGHGLGSARMEGIMVGHLEEQRKYVGLGIGRYALQRLLWETGLVGTFLYSMIFLFAIISARRLSINIQVTPFHQAIAKAAQITGVVFMISLLYAQFMINCQAINALWMFVLGYILFLDRQVKSAKKRESERFEFMRKNGHGASVFDERKDLV